MSTNDTIFLLGMMAFLFGLLWLLARGGRD